jgi:hypothetical protein
MEVLITDVTVMHGGYYCVAGWCANEDKMIDRFRLDIIGPTLF